MVKRLFMVTMAVLLVSVLLLAGCGQAPPQSPAPAPTPSPASKPAVAPAPAPSTAPSAAPAAAPAAGAQKPIELRFSHHNPPAGRTTVMMLNPWAKKLEEATKGRVKVTMYPAQSLATSLQNLEALKSGLADIAWLQLGNWTGRWPLTEIMSLPFSGILGGKLDGRNLSPAAVNSRIFQELYEKSPELQAEWTDVKVFMLFTGDPYFPITIKKQVRNTADIKGMKIRTFGKWQTQLYKNLGASSLLLAAPDVYDAAQKGVIDGIAGEWALIVTWKYYEVAKYYTDAGMDTSLHVLAMNKEKWESLPPDIQQQMMSVAGAGGAEFVGEQFCGFGVQEDAVAAMKKANKEMQKIDLDAGEYDKWKDVAKPSWDTWLGEMKAKGLQGQKVIDELGKLQAKYKG